mgnify:CR=1 FL=1
MRTANRWFDIRAFDNGVTRIREACLDPAVACNIWVIHGRDRHLVMDSGTGLMSLKQAFPQLARHPVVCIASHTHFDHCGGSWEFEDRRVHENEADILRRPTRENTTVEGYMVPELFVEYPFEGFRPQDYQVRPAPPTGVLADGDVIDLGDRSLTVLHLPGHSPGLTGLYEPATRMLFPSDAIYDGPLYDDVYHSDIRDYQRTMKRLLDLEVSVVHGGHFESFGQQRMHTLIRNWLDNRLDI